MSDTRTLRIEELTRAKEQAKTRARLLAAIRRVVAEHAESNSEKVWVLATIDNKIALQRTLIDEWEYRIQLARENAQPEVGALFIDGKKVEMEL